MAGTTYDVNIEFHQKGDLGVSRLAPAVASLNSGVSRLTGGVSQIGAGFSRLMAPLDAVVSRIVDAGIGIAKWGAAGAIGLATYGVVGLNNELEKTRISLATIFSVQGKASNLTQGMGIASDQIAKMRKDAAALPGEFSDLVSIFRTAAIPGFQAGLSVDKMREMSAKIMAAGAVTGLPMDQVAREAAMLMSGRAGAHNVFGMRLMGLSGEAAEKFNKLAPEQRVAKMSAELDKFAPAINEFGKSFEGISTSFIDNVKQFGTAATSGLFEGVKDLLGNANEWFAQNKTQITAWAEHISFSLQHAFYVGIDAIKEWWPAIQQFAENAYSRLSEIWTKIGPSVQRFGESLQAALKDPGTIDKLIRLAEVYAGLKIAGGIMSTVSAIGQTLGGLSTIAKFAGFGGGFVGRAVAGAAGAAGSAAGAAGTGLLGGLVEAAGGGLATFGPALVSAGAALLPFAAAIGAATAASYGLSKVLEYSDTFDWHAMFDVTDLKKFNEENMKVIETMTGLDFGFSHVADSAEFLATQMELAANQVAVAGGQINTKVNDFFLAIAKQGPGGGTPTAERERPRKPLHPGGGGGTTVQKVEIVVTSNQEPSRIARAVEIEFTKKLHRSGRSPDVANYSRPSGT